MTKTLKSLFIIILVFSVLKASACSLSHALDIVTKRAVRSLYVAVPPRTSTISTSHLIENCKRFTTIANMDDTMQCIQYPTSLDGPVAKIILRCLHGPQAEPYLADIAKLRIKFFAEYPYLYRGSLDSEQKYLKTYFASQNSLITLIFDTQNVVGFSSSIPLSEESEAISQPFLNNHMDISQTLYLGEGIVLPRYRSIKLVRELFTIHETFAKTKHLSKATFMTVERSENHPAKSKEYKSLDPLWTYFGYKRIPVEVNLPWLRVDTGKEESNTLQFWMKDLTV